jgi:NADH-quinone oxidoreductase subunit C
VPDQVGLELIATQLGSAIPGSVLGTSFFREQAGVIVAPPSVRQVLAELQNHGYRALMSVHGVDYYPEEPRLGVLYELLDMERVDRLTIKLRVPLDEPHVESVTEDWPTANHQEREIYDMFGVEFRRASRPAPDPDARGLRGPPAAARLPGRRRAGAVHAQRCDLTRVDAVSAQSEYRKREESDHAFAA